MFSCELAAVVVLS